jgi:hypothetical protein
MVALPLFDVVLSSQRAADRSGPLAAELIESALGELERIERIDQSLAPPDPARFDRPSMALIRGMYESWASDVDALLDRIRQVERRFGKLDSAERLRDAQGRTRAMLAISLDDMEEARRQIVSGKLHSLEEVRRDLGLGVH